MWVGQLSCWAQRVGHEFGPIILVSPMENNKFCHILVVNFIYIYIYIYICVCVCVCVLVNIQVYVSIYL